MLPARLVILLCPSCGGGIVFPTSVSWNTFGLEYWSDGKNVTPLSREPRPLTRCSLCSSCFWVADARCEGTLDDDDELPLEEPAFLRKVKGLRGALPRGGDHREPPPRRPRSRTGLGSGEDPSEADYLQLLLQERPPMEERYLRFKIWWDTNDKYRGRDWCDDPVVFSSEQELNLRKLYRILEDDRPTDRLLKAEIHRELGEFDAALRICDRLEVDGPFAISGDGFIFLHRTRRQSEMAFRRVRRVVKYDWP